MDILHDKSIRPMLIGTEESLFDDPSYLYELKLDGMRCIAYLVSDSTDLRSERSVGMLPTKVPELTGIHRQVKHPCILDGVLSNTVNSAPVSFERQRRSLLSDGFKPAVPQNPITFVTFDILYLDGEPTTHLPLLRRKRLLSETVVENERLTVAPYIEGEGTALYELSKRRGLEGIVAKHKESRYSCNQRTKDWVMIKNISRDDFIVCGYAFKGGDAVSLILGAFDAHGVLFDCGSVMADVSGEAFRRIQEAERVAYPLFAGESPQTVWLKPELVCAVRYTRLQPGGLRQPVFMGLQENRDAGACRV